MEVSELVGGGICTKYKQAECPEQMEFLYTQPTDEFIPHFCCFLNVFKIFSDSNEPDISKVAVFLMGFNRIQYNCTDGH